MCAGCICKCVHAHSGKELANLASNSLGFTIQGLPETQRGILTSENDGFSGISLPSSGITRVSVVV